MRVCCASDEVALDSSRGWRGWGEALRIVVQDLSPALLGGRTLTTRVASFLHSVIYIAVLNTDKGDKLLIKSENK